MKIVLKTHVYKIPKQKNQPGVFVKNIGGGGTLNPLIGDTQALLLISCCSTDKYAAIMQNSSKLIKTCCSSLVVCCCCDVSRDEIVIVSSIPPSVAASLYVSTILFKFSIESIVFGKPKQLSAFWHCTRLMVSFDSSTTRSYARRTDLKYID